MYFVASTAFLNYFDELINMLDAPFFHNITRQEHILPISLESDDFDKELLSAPETLRELVEKFKQRKIKFWLTAQNFRQRRWNLHRNFYF